MGIIAWKRWWLMENQVIAIWDFNTSAGEQIYFVLTHSIGLLNDHCKIQKLKYFSAQNRIPDGVTIYFVIIMIMSVLLSFFWANVIVFTDLISSEQISMILSPMLDVDMTVCHLNIVILPPIGPVQKAKPINHPSYIHAKPV